MRTPLTWPGVSRAPHPSPHISPMTELAEVPRASCNWLVRGQLGCLKKKQNPDISIFNPMLGCLFLFPETPHLLFSHCACLQQMKWLCHGMKWDSAFSWKRKNTLWSYKKKHTAKVMYKRVQSTFRLNNANFQNRSDTLAKFQVSITFWRGARAIKKS